MTSIVVLPSYKPWNPKLSENVTFPPRENTYTLCDADNIIGEHAIHWLICIETYHSPRKYNIGQWLLIYQDKETCLYKNKNRLIFGFRGTKESKDIYDDVLLSLRETYPRAAQAIEYVSEMKRLNPYTSIELTGHSLGGAIARDVGKATQLPSITFNAASPPSRPVISEGVDYHIVFDIISAWQSPTTIRIDKGHRPPNFMVSTALNFLSLRESIDAHKLKYFSKSFPGKTIDAKTENSIVQGWFLGIPFKYRLYVLSILGIRGVFVKSLPEIID